MTTGDSAGVAVVTGAASGMGVATAKRFAALGWTVAALDRDADSLAAVYAGQPAVRPYDVDLSDSPAVGRVAEAVFADVGTPTALTCFAGVAHFKPFEETSPADWASVIAGNLTTAVEACRWFGGRMRQARGGAVVLVASTGGLFGIPDMSAYVAAKHAVAGLARALAVEWGRDGVRVNCIAPGATLTPMLLATGPEYIRERERRVPLGRLADPDDQAELACFLCGPGARNLTGVVLPSDGGVSALAPGTATSVLDRHAIPSRKEEK